MIRDTSLEAYGAVKPELNELQADVLAVVKDLRPTAEEAADAMGRYLYTVAPRITELQKLGLVRDSGERRMTRRRRRAVVWEAVPRGASQLALSL